VHDDFFELGGHSLVAVQMLLEVERVLGIDVPVVWMVEGGSTVAGLAELIEAGGPISVDAVLDEDTPAAGVESVRSRVKPRLVFIWSGQPDVLSLRYLRRCLDRSAAITSIAPDRPITSADTVDGIVDLLLQQLRIVQPEGPYALAGYSFAAVVAYEMAGRLRADGETVSWIALLDEPTPNAVLNSERMGPRLARLLDQDSASRRARLAEVVRQGRKVARRRGTQPAVNSPYQDEMKLLLSLLAVHTVNAHDIPIEIFATDYSIWRFRSASIGWADVHQGPLRVTRVPDDHSTLLLPPVVDTLGGLMAERFSHVHGGARSATM
jgi:thioesterase domain-containing protein